VAGARDSSWNRPRKTPTYDLGQVPLGEVNWLFNALDIAVITNRTNTFGEHCYPQKLHEMLACKTPVIAARTSAFSRHPLPDGVIATYSPQSPSELAQAIWAAAIHKERTNTIEFKADTWHERANQLQFILENEHQHHL
ncbi:glycosyltransferase, partial [Thioalkalivibrio sp. ALE11]